MVPKLIPDPAPVPIQDTGFDYSMIIFVNMVLAPDNSRKNNTENQYGVFTIHIPQIQGELKSKGRYKNPTERKLHADNPGQIQKPILM